MLEQTHSPFAAEGDRSINVVSVQKSDGSTDIVPIMNFHEARTIISDQAAWSVVC